MELNRCAYTILGILRTKKAKNMFKPSNIKYPQFFKFAKGKKSSSLEVYTNSPMDRIPQYIDIEVGRKHFMYDVGTDEDNKKKSGTPRHAVKNVVIA